ncbi:MAG: hypothetical protein HY910_09695 [Desulfarculus sp.]|nr:hypothetical protein [Desulfarculus sp.]
MAIPRPKPPRSHALLGLVLWGVAAGHAWYDVPWARLWYYHLAWWGYIIFADGLVKQRTGNSLLWDRQGAFAFMALASTTFWFFFELINLAALNNWHYEGVARITWLRWLGAHVAFATVLPGVLVTYELLTAWGVLGQVRVRPLGTDGPGQRPCHGSQQGLLRPQPQPARLRPVAGTPPWYPGFLAIGGLMLLLPLLWPGLFFPLVWGALVFLLEPLNHRYGAPSLMRDWQAGDLSVFCRLLLAGLICGLLWESQNFLSSARWVYTLPWLNEPKLFAMPLAGYLGFPAFAVECYVAMSSLSLLRGGRGWRADDHRRATRPGWPAWSLALLAGAALAFNLAVLYLMDQRVVMSFGD